MLTEFTPALRPAEQGWRRAEELMLIFNSQVGLVVALLHDLLLWHFSSQPMGVQKCIPCQPTGSMRLFSAFSPPPVSALSAEITGFSGSSPTLSACLHNAVHNEVAGYYGNKYGHTASKLTST